MISRRQILSAVSAAIALPMLAPVSALAARRAGPSEAGQVLTLKHLHTHETERFSAGSIDRLNKQDIKRFNHFMRDHHNGQIGKMDPSLIFHLMALQRSLGSAGTPFEVLSAYRSDQTNAKLRRRSKRVAVKSMHLRGQAIDIRLPGVTLSDLHMAALDQKAGGVGLYKRSKFIHFDTGRVRRW